MATVAAITAFLEAIAPLHLAAPWDNVGLLLGDREQPVRRVMTCLTVTPESAAEAVEDQADLIVTHHPIFFRPMQRLTTATPEGRMLLSLIAARVAVYSPHTAFDNAPGGINEMIGQRLGLDELMVLRPAAGQGQVKIVVFVPISDLAQVSDALFAAGAGHIGHYRECSFRSPGTGTFFGLDAAHPTVGRKGRREDVEEWRLEVVCPEDRMEGALAALRQAHSYEEPAYDIYPLRAKAVTRGEGRVGRLPLPMTLMELAEKTKQALKAAAVQLVGEGNRSVHRVAIGCGAGGSLLDDAVRAGADALLTGEARFHEYLAAQARGMALVLPGHFASERPGVELLADSLQRQWPDLRVWASHRERDPIAWQ